MQTNSNNMLKHQIQCWGCTNQHALHILASIDRAVFVPTALQHLSYNDTTIPIGNAPDEIMLTPNICGRIMQELCEQFTQKINRCLIVGAGTGYLVALLAQLSSKVVAYEISTALYQTAKQNLTTLNITNAEIINDNAFINVFEEVNYFDCIVLTGGAPVLPTVIGDKLIQGGRILAFVGEDIMTLQSMLKLPSGAWSYQSILDTKVPLLQGLPALSQFEF